ncbi:hypothetical protein [Mucilaginibacter sp. SP1R1]|nr:hypothetical protein [Mucilaginibacter sp. SP1R1]MBB6152774.1 hypothetical protein [Mucilaginibacter sp. SP1R1]
MADDVYQPFNIKKADKVLKDAICKHRETKEDVITLKKANRLVANEFRVA